MEMTEEKGGSRRKSSGALISVEEKRSYGEERAWRRSRQGGGRKIRQAGITGGSQQKMVPGRGEKSCQTLLRLGIIIQWQCGAKRLTTFSLGFSIWNIVYLLIVFYMEAM